MQAHYLSSQADSVRFLILFAASALLYGCGSGLVGIGVLSSGSGGGGNPTDNSVSVDSFTDDDRSSPGTIRVTVRGSGGGARVEFFIQVGDGDEAVIDVTGSTTGLDLTQGGQTIDVTWDYADDPNVGAFAADVVIGARLRRSSGGDLSTDRLEPRKVGNLVPTLNNVQVPGESASGIAKISFDIADPSDNEVKLKVEFQEVDSEDESWSVASPSVPEGGGSGSLDEDGFLITSFVPGSGLLFFWESSEDLPSQEANVKLRLTVKDLDPAVVGEPVETSTFVIDNNVAPIVLVDSGSLVLNEDRRRGVVVPFQLRDEDDSEVDYVIQWRRTGQDLENDGIGLPGSPEEIRAILNDRDERERFQILSERAALYSGTTELVDSGDDPDGTRVRLPELASSANGLLDFGGLADLELEILRPEAAPQTSGGFWAGIIDNPVSAIPLGDGERGLILDTPNGGSGWQLRKLSLGDGSIVRNIASSAGVPQSMAISRVDSDLDEDPEFALIADGNQGGRIRRIDIQTGAITGLVNGLVDPVRGMTVLGPVTAAFTQGSALRLLNLETKSVTTVLDDLFTPWGVVRDATRPNLVYVSENTFPGTVVGRVSVIDLALRTTTPLLASGIFTLSPIERPQSVTLESGGERLLVVTDASNDGVYEIRGINLGGLRSGVGFEVQAGLTGPVADLHSGANNLRVLAMGGIDDLAIGGGIAQRRVIETYDAATQIVTVGVPFDPPLTEPFGWQIENKLPATLPSTPSGTRARFVWNSEDVLGGGNVILRAVAFDEDVGVLAETDAPKNIAGPLSVDPLFLTLGGSNPNPKMVVSADLDGDSDLDLITANEGSGTLNIHFQTSPRTFGSAFVVGGGGSTDGAAAVAAADVDKDGLLDIVSANASDNNLTLFFQNGASPGTFDPPITISDGSVLDPRAVAIADLNGDNLMDIVSANRASSFTEECGASGSAGSVTIFFQDGGGAFNLSVDGPLVDVDAEGPRDLALSDIDSDGDLDIVCANEFSHTISVFFQQPAGDFDTLPPLILGTGETTTTPKGVIVADLNGDGREDIASANFGNNSIAFFFQDSSGGFGIVGGGGVEPNVNVGDFFNTKGPLDLQAGDLDRDGDIDLISTNRFDDNITLLFQTAPGVFEIDPNGPLADTGTFPGPESLVIADLDGDARLDIVTASSGLCTGAPGNDKLTVLFQSTPGLLAKDPFSPLRNPKTVCPDSVASGDLDRDGDLDLVLASGSNLSIFFQITPGVFLFDRNSPIIESDPADSSFFGGPKKVLAVDVDGDSDLDIVSSNFDSNNITILEQATPGRFLLKSTLTDGSNLENPFGLFARDLNRDGFIDLAVTYTNPGGIALFFGSLAGFSPTADRIVLGENFSQGIESGDFDGDQREDLIVAAAGGVFVYRQLSNGNFSEVTSISAGVGSNAQGVAVDDLDGDGDLDFVIGARGSGGSFTDGRLTTFLQNSTSFSFTLGQTLIQGDGIAPGSVAIADLDTDGDADIVVANEGDSGGNNLRVFLQVSPGFFSEAQTLGNTNETFSPRAVIASDLDGDGDPDVASANFAGDSVTIFFGSH